MISMTKKSEEPKLGQRPIILEDDVYVIAQALDKSTLEVLTYVENVIKPKLVNLIALIILNKVDNIRSVHDAYMLTDVVDEKERFLTTIVTRINLEDYLCNIGKSIDFSLKALSLAEKEEVNFELKEDPTIKWNHSSIMGIALPEEECKNYYEKQTEILLMAFNEQKDKSGEMTAVDTFKMSYNVISSISNTPDEKYLGYCTLTGLFQKLKNDGKNEI